MAIGIALLGAGLFARDEHLPAIEACSLLSLKAIYSQSQQSADRLARTAKKPTDIYFDSPTNSAESLDNLLDRDDIDAVIIALPILVQPDVIKRAIAAGKHVLSEKPIAKDVQEAVQLIRWFNDRAQGEVWSVGENFRFFEPLDFAAQQVRKMGGEIVSLSVEMYGLVEESDEYYQSTWRRKPKYQGGLLLGGGISYIAGLRSLLNAAGTDITHVAAATSLRKPHLAPTDTVHATLHVSNGKPGTFSISFGAEKPYPFEIQVVTEKGAVMVQPTAVIVITRGSKKGQSFSFEPGKGVKQEVAAFAQSIKKGERNERASPEQALKDLRVLEAMLASSQANGKKLELCE